MSVRASKAIVASSAPRIRTPRSARGQVLLELLRRLAHEAEGSRRSCSCTSLQLRRGFVLTRFVISRHTSTRIWQHSLWSGSQTTRKASKYAPAMASARRAELEVANTWFRRPPRGHALHPCVPQWLCSLLLVLALRAPRSNCSASSSGVGATRVSP